MEKFENIAWLNAVIVAVTRSARARARGNPLGTTVKMVNNRDPTVLEKRDDLGELRGVYGGIWIQRIRTFRMQNWDIVERIMSLSMIGYLSSHA